jgi:hypothetical protein
MTAPSTPLIDPSDLGVLLYDSDSIDEPRAKLMIRYAQDLCESVVSPLPASCAVVVARVASRGYTTTTSTRGAHMSMAGSAFGMPPGADGGVFLTRQDKSDLRRLAGNSNAFTINLLPSTYQTIQPPWDVDAGLTDAGRE